MLGIKQIISVITKYMNRKKVTYKSKNSYKVKTTKPSCMFFLNKTPKPEWYEKLKMEERVHV